MSEEDDGGARLDYEHTTDLIRALTDVRFKLLAFVPTISGATVALFGTPRPAIELLAVGLLGLAATLGVVVYELRNTTLLAYAGERAARLEARLGLPSLWGGAAGGLWSEAPAPPKWLGLVTIAQDRGLAFVYGAALAGWAYLVTWGALRAFDVADARKAGLAVGAAVGVLAGWGLGRFGAGLTAAPDEEPAPAGGPA